MNIYIFPIKILISSNYVFKEMSVLNKFYNSEEAIFNRSSLTERGN